jgi:hypothetical protein
MGDPSDPELLVHSEGFVLLRDSVPRLPRHKCLKIGIVLKGAS